MCDLACRIRCEETCSNRCDPKCGPAFAACSAPFAARLSSCITGCDGNAGCRTLCYNAYNSAVRDTCNPADRACMLPCVDPCRRDCIAEGNSERQYGYGTQSVQTPNTYQTNRQFQPNLTNVNHRYSQPSRANRCPVCDSVV
jgi:hypothetical protein